MFVVPQVRRTVVTRVHEAVKALALCHNVTPVSDDTSDEATRLRIDSVTSDESDADGIEGAQDSFVKYQASSPDEVSRPWGISRAVSERCLRMMGFLQIDGKHSVLKD